MARGDEPTTRESAEATPEVAWVAARHPNYTAVTATPDDDFAFPEADRLKLTQRECASQQGVA